MHPDRIVQSLWVGADLPLLQQLSIASFLANGHEYHLYTYGDVSNVPPGTVVMDANEVLGHSRIVRDRGETGYAGFSDVFRYQLLLEKGGWWVDTDQVCLRFFDFPSEYVFSSEHGADGSPATPNSGVIKAPAGAPFLQYAVDVCRSKNLKDIAWAEIGLGLTGAAIRKFSLQSYVEPPETFCPLHWSRFWDMLKPDAYPDLPESAYAVHLWNSIWGRLQRNPNAAYHPRSAYEGWKLRYLHGSCPRAPVGP